MKLFIERPVATGMFYLAALILGAYSFTSTPLEIAPGGDYPRLDIETAWPGISPEVVYSLVTARLEEAASLVKGVREMSSESQEGVSRLTLGFERGTHMEFAALALREAVAGVSAGLPSEVRPVIRPFVPEEFRARPFLRLMIAGPMEAGELRELLKEKIERGLASLKGLASAEVGGGQEPGLRIEVHPEKLRALGLHPGQVRRAVGRNLLISTAGSIRIGGREHILKIRGPVRTARDLNQAIVARSGSYPVRLSDIARNVGTLDEPESINRFNGQPTILATIRKGRGANSLKTARDVKGKLASLGRELPPGLTIKIIDDEAGELRNALVRLSILASIITGLALAVIFAVIRHFTPSLLVLSSVVFSVVMTFNLSYLFGLSLNMLTLGALALGLGMFVDNSIVVFENILRLREEGNPPLEAAIRGPREVMKPVLSSTLTTICVFFSFPFFQGRLRDYYLPLAFVMAIALTASVFVSFSLIPALSPFLLIISRAGRKAPGSRACIPHLRFVLRRGPGFILAAAALLAGSHCWFDAKVEKGEFFHWHEKNRLTIWIRMPPGGDISRADEAARKFEDAALAAAGETEVNSIVTAETAYVSIDFPASLERAGLPGALKEKLIGLAAQFAGISIGIYGSDGPGYFAGGEADNFSNSGIRVSGYNLKKLKALTTDLENSLRTNPRTRNIRTVSSRLSGRLTDESPEHILRLKREAAGTAGLDLPALYSQLQTLIPGLPEATLRTVLEGRRTEISFMFPGTESLSTEGILNSKVQAEGGISLKLSDIFSLESKFAPAPISRENRQFRQTVAWEYRGPAKAAGAFEKAQLDRMRLPPGFQAGADDFWRMTEEEEGEMRTALFISLAAIYLILAAFYDSLLQPFFVMSAVPLSMIGVFTAFVLSGYPFDSSAYVGVILLCGIVVNNSILIVDNINLKRHQGASLPEAVVHGTAERIRPMLMTASTTVLGTLPMLLVDLQSGGRQLWSTLALATVGGLISSTLLLPAVIPVFYYHGERARLHALKGLESFVSSAKRKMKSGLFLN